MFGEEKDCGGHWGALKRMRGLVGTDKDENRDGQEEPKRWSTGLLYSLSLSYEVGDLFGTSIFRPCAYPRRVGEPKSNRIRSSHPGSVHLLDF